MPQTLRQGHFVRLIQIAFVCVRARKLVSKPCLHPAAKQLRPSVYVKNVWELENPPVLVVAKPIVVLQEVQVLGAEVASDNNRQSKHPLSVGTGATWSRRKLDARVVFAL